MSLLRRFHWLILDVISLPGLIGALFGAKRFNAQWHLRYVCPRCPAERRKLRDLGDGACAWNAAWARGNYSGSTTFGFWRWLRQYTRRTA